MAKVKINKFFADGHAIRFSARSLMDNGRVYQEEHTVFVAPHDPRKEMRSTRSSLFGRIAEQVRIRMG